ncbi:hypothetical protein KP509_22G035500 [Ceratopteris richardii]|uniref:Response regulatory domain-containing protein n=1 Tax=Ceratopteris richardii TaxID=49495 RepID=A0A8T2S3Y2_CERRI|nr:hypothetical protein KP509_22G035500 [Ceratopteris richardii]
MGLRRIFNALHHWQCPLGIPAFTTAVALLFTAYVYSRIIISTIFLLFTSARFSTLGLQNKAELVGILLTVSFSIVLIQDGYYQKYAALVGLLNMQIGDPFPAGLRVLVVDDDPICLLIVERLLRSCLYQVTTCQQAVMALSILRENKNSFDVVLSDVHMPNMDGFAFLEQLRLEMDVPVIMMSANGDTNNVMKGISIGACDYLLKPVRLEELQNIWQHVVRKKYMPVKVSSCESEAKDLKKAQIIQKESDRVTDGGSSSSRSLLKRREFLEESSLNEQSLCTAKRQRVVWSVDLHRKFVCAINHLEAVPKRILDLMNVPGLTRENVASHLQKYRLYLIKNQQRHHPWTKNPIDLC